MRVLLVDDEALALDRLRTLFADIEDVELVRQLDGVEVRMLLPPGRAAALAVRRRALAGPPGCGLCGVESLAARPGRSTPPRSGRRRRA